MTDIVTKDADENVERVAIAIAGAGIFPSSIPWEKCAEVYREEQRIRARAAIAAMESGK